MLLFHGSKYDIKKKIKPHKAHCADKEYGNMFGVYCSNNPAYAFAFSVIKNRELSSWSYDGKNMIIVENGIEVNEYVYLYYILSDNYIQLSKKQFLIMNSIDYYLKKRITVSAFVKIDRENGIITIDNTRLEEYILSFFKLINEYHLLCHELNLDYCKAFVNIISEMNDCDEKEYYIDHIHGYDHMWRTSLYSFLIYHKSQLDLSSNNLYNLLKSAYYHDIGRYVDNNSVRHGSRGYELFRNKYKSDGDDAICEELILLHDQETIYSSILLKKLSGILKDADAIDRLRFHMPNQQPSEHFINDASTEVYEIAKKNYESIYQNKSIPIYILPFAYNGPCITECGPLVIGHEIKKNILFSQFDLIEIKQNFFESSLDYLKRIELEITINFNDMAAFLGGNHLSLLPVYRVAKEKGYSIVVLDAHRDYKKQNEISHASFINYLSDVPIVIFGYRDKLDLVAPDNVVLYSPEQLSDFLEYVSKQNNIYLDIDVDVLDPADFPCTYSKIDGGIKKNDFFKIINELSSKTKWFSISEYAPVLDYKNYYRIIEKALLMAFRRIYE